MSALREAKPSEARTARQYATERGPTLSRCIGRLPFKEA
jgi:hypothetical protein